MLFGATSILGFQLAQLFSRRVLPFAAPRNRGRTVHQWPVLQLGDPCWTAALFERYPPEVLLYCHAVCDVPKCEAAPEWAHDVNVAQLRRVTAALPRETRLVYVSSDHVFGGDGTYDEKSPPSPISAYGRSRVEAEQLVLKRPRSLVIRTGLAIGPSPDGRSGHWDWLRYRTEHNLPITIVHDEYRSVVWARDLARRVMQLADSRETGVCHVSATRVLSRVELADYLLCRFGMTCNYSLVSRHQRAVPHLGRVELASIHRGGLFQPLASVIEE